MMMMKRESSLMMSLQLPVPADQKNDFELDFAESQRSEFACRPWFDDC